MSEPARVEVHITVKSGTKIKPKDLETIVRAWADGREPPRGVKIDLVEWRNFQRKTHGIAKTKDERARLARLLRLGYLSHRKVRKN
jgi:hypothetical protein